MTIDAALQLRQVLIIQMQNCILNGRFDLYRCPALRKSLISVIVSLWHKVIIRYYLNGISLVDLSWYASWKLLHDWSIDFLHAARNYSSRSNWSTLSVIFLTTRWTVTTASWWTLIMNTSLVFQVLEHNLNLRDNWSFYLHKLWIGNPDFDKRYS